MVHVLAMVAAAMLGQVGPRQDVVFQINQTTTPGQSVFVQGDLAELGGSVSSPVNAVKLEPGAYPTWRATISLPAGRTYTYRFLIRSDAAGQGGNASNGTPVTGWFTATTAAGARDIPGKVVVYQSGWDGPVLNWRQDQGVFIATPMRAVEAGRFAGERRFVGRLVGAIPGASVEFFISNPATGGRDPATGTYATAVDGVLLQDGNLFTYEPAASVGAARRDYNAASPPTIVSSNLNGETRRYRVFLPRGYDQHTWKRYPVLYMHDGQNVFEVGPFGSWNAATTVSNLQRLAQMREVIVVGIDNGPNRLSDYAAPDSGGWGDRYTRFIRDELKPRIDQQYRTIPDASVTGTAGSSMGGQISLYQGWDFSSTFTRVGAFSGAWNVYNSGFYNRVFQQPKRAIRIYMDSGDSGTASDNYWLTYNLRDNLLSKPGAAYVQRGDLLHVVGFGQQHNEAAWAARLPGCLTFLYPAAEEPSAFTAYWWIKPGRGEVLEQGGGVRVGPGAVER